MGDQRTSIELDLNVQKESESKPKDGNDDVAFPAVESESEFKPKDDDDDVALPAAIESGDAPDGGWGWIVVIASFFISVIVDGICYTFGVIKPDLDEYFGTKSSTTAWAGSLLGGFYLIAGPIVSAMANKFGCRRVCIVGSCIAAFAFFLSSFSQNIEMLLFTYGVIGGIGFGMMYLPAIVMVGYYFDKRRALATGIAVCGSGLGTFIMAPLATFLLETFTWRGTNIVLAALILNGVAFGALYRPLSVKILKSSDDEDNAFIIQQIANEKRSRYYSNDEKSATDENEPSANLNDDVFLQCNGAQDQVVPGKRSRHASATEKRALRSRNASRADDDPEKQTRSRHVSRVSFASDTEKKPFDRQDALFTGNLMGTREFKECGADLSSYVHSVSSLHQATAGEKKTNKHIARLHSVVGLINEMFDFTLLKSPTFILVCLSGVFVFTGLFTPFVYGPAKAELLGASPAQASLLLSVLGACNTVSRIITGFIADLPRVDCVFVHNIAAILAGVFTCLVCVFNTYELLVLYAALFGIFIAAYIALRSIIIVELMGISKLTNAFGLLSLCQGVAVLFGSPMTGAMYDATQSYSVSFLVSGLIIAAGGIICLPVRRIARWELSRQQSYDIVKANETTATDST